MGFGVVFQRGGNVFFLKTWLDECRHPRMNSTNFFVTPQLKRNRCFEGFRTAGTKGAFFFFVGDGGYLCFAEGVII